MQWRGHPFRHPKPGLRPATTAVLRRGSPLRAARRQESELGREAGGGWIPERASPPFATTDPRETVQSRWPERFTDRVQNLGGRRDAFETMRDLAAEGYRAETWRPRKGSHSSQTGKLTSAAIDARDYLCARKDRKISAHLPEGTLVAFTGGKNFDDVAAIWRSLDSIKMKYDDMILLYEGGSGAEKIAASWAEKNGVHQIVCKLDWNRDGKAAPFRRNDVLLNFLPKGLVAFPGSGITNNMIDKARKIGIPVLCIAA